MADPGSIAAIIGSFSISNAMLIRALEQSGMLTGFDFAMELRVMAEAEERAAPKRDRKRKADFHILRHVVTLIEINRNQPRRRRAA